MSLKKLEKKIETGEFLATEVTFALECNQADRVNTLLIKAMLEIKDLDEPWLQRVLEQTAVKLPVPKELPWDRTLLTNRLIIELYAQQLDNWEQGIDV